MHFGYQGFGCFVVKTLKFWREASGLEHIDRCFVSFYDLFFGFGCHWYSVDVIGIVVVKDKNVFVARRGWNSKMSCLVGVYFTSDCLACRKHMLCACGVVGADWDSIKDV